MGDGLIDRNRKLMRPLPRTYGAGYLWETVNSANYCRMECSIAGSGQRVPEWKQANITQPQLLVRSRTHASEEKSLQLSVLEYVTVASWANLQDGRDSARSSRPIWSHHGDEMPHSDRTSGSLGQNQDLHLSILNTNQGAGKSR